MTSPPNFAQLVDCKTISAISRLVTVRLRTQTFGRAGLYFCNHENFPFFLKLAPEIIPSYSCHRDGATTEQYKPAIDVEIAIMRLLRNNEIPHVVRMYDSVICDDIYRFDVNEDRVNEIMMGRVDPDLSVHDTICRFICDHKRGFATQRAAFMFMELCPYNLRYVIVHTVPVDSHAAIIYLRSIIFQVLFGLLAIKTKWIDFSHGDMHMGNVLVMRSPHTDTAQQSLEPVYAQYTFRNKCWNVPYYWFDAKIADFNMSSIPSEGLHSKYVGAQFGIKRPKRIADHIYFCAQFQNMLDEANLSEYRTICSAFNPRDITPRTLLSLYPDMTPEQEYDSLLSTFEKVFEDFEVEVPEHSIVRRCEFART